MKNFTLECCVDSVESAIQAQKGGATRLEVCSNLVIGGTSPSISLLKQIKKYVDLPVRVLVRPRFGDFNYTSYEIEIIEDEIKNFLNIGANGFVIGCLNVDGSLNIDYMSRLISKAKGLPITLHRAFDMCKNPILAMKQAKAIGVSTILTSGAQNTAIEGVDLLKILSENSNGIEILAGSGITPQSVKYIKERTNITSFHMSGKVIKKSKMEYKNKNVYMGINGMNEYEIFETDKEIVKQVRKILETN